MERQMEKKLRLDKYLADMGIGTRSEVKQYIRKGFIKVNNEIMKTPDCKIGPDDLVFYHDKQVSYLTYEYYMLNKPAGVVSATTDSHCKTVIDLITCSKRKDLFPVGRLDKDTEGLLLITNDGELAHQLLSPKKKVGKWYYAHIEGQVTQEDVEAFQEGLHIDEDFTALPATLRVVKAGKISEIEVEVHEGKFHQIKRMFEAVGKKVIYLKRLSMGPLTLDANLGLGEYRKLTKEELDSLQFHKK